MRWLTRFLDRFRRGGSASPSVSVSPSASPSASASSGDARHDLGLRGEALAERYLVALGMRCLARRYSGPMGELDLVMEHGKTIVFVEVKTQSGDAFNQPHERITPRKQQKLIRVAKAYLIDRRLTDRPCRFDVVGITLTEGEPKIEHFTDAFRPPGVR